VRACQCVRARMGTCVFVPVTEYMCMYLYVHVCTRALPYTCTMYIYVRDCMCIYFVYIQQCEKNICNIRINTPRLPLTLTSLFVLALVQGCPWRTHATILQLRDLKTKQSGVANVCVCMSLKLWVHVCVWESREGEKERARVRLFVVRGRSAYVIIWVSARVVCVIACVSGRTWAVCV